MMFRGTLASELEFRGVGIHSGQVATMRLFPAASGTGRVFVRRDLDNAEVAVVPAHIESANRATGLKAGEARIRTPEHILSALNAMGISDCRIALDSEEVPILDGSSAPFAKAILDAGVVSFSTALDPLVIQSPLHFSEKDGEINVFPSDQSIFGYELDYPEPIGHQQFEFELSAERFCSQVAPARTFGFFSEYDQLLKSGLAKGASFENALVFMNDGTTSAPPRFDDEPVRHKVLDMIGDFAILGRPILGRIIGKRSGHALNLAVVKVLFELESR